MKIREAWRQAWQVYRAQWPEMMVLALVRLAMDLISAAPLLLMIANETRPFALLCLPLIVLLVLPLRQSAADALQRALNGEKNFAACLAWQRDYQQKLLRGIKQTLLMLLWAAPFLAVTSWAAWLYSAEGVQGETDAVTLMLKVSSLGGGDLLRGAAVAVGLYALTLLPLLCGLAFHSGTRHAWALGDRSILAGHRGGVMRLWLTELVVFVPFLLALLLLLAGYMPALVAAFKTFAFDTLPSPKRLALEAFAASLVLLLPLLPLRALVTAAYLRAWKDKQA